MARIPQITSKEAVPPDKRYVFDAIVASRGRVGGPFSILMHSPDTAERTAHLGAYLRYESTLPKTNRELAIITTAREFDCNYEWSAHATLALEAGVSEATVNAVAKRSDVDGLPEDDALIIRFGRELHRKHQISDATFQAAQQRFGEQGVVELTAIMGYYALLAYTLNTFEVQPAPDTPRLP